MAGLERTKKGGGGEETLEGNLAGLDIFSHEGKKGEDGATKR